MTKFRLIVSIVLFVVSVTGSILSALGLVAKNEPQLVLQLSWFALIYESFNSIQISADNKKQDDK